MSPTFDSFPFKTITPPPPSSRPLHYSKKSKHTQPNMGRKKSTEQESLEIKIPTFFRCPISLDVMKSPVSLCTGVTYDRASIQRWIDSGNTTCPATMQPLPSTDLIPNLTLQRLIRIWAASIAPAEASPGLPRDIIIDLRSAADPLPHLRRLAAFFSDADVEDFTKNSLISLGGCPAALASLDTHKLEAREAVIETFAQILAADGIEDANKQLVVSSLVSHFNHSLTAIMDVLRSSRLDPRIKAARVLDRILAWGSDPETKIKIAEKQDLIFELIRLIGPSEGKDGRVDRRAVEAGLACLTGLIPVRRARVRMVRLGIVPALTRVLLEESIVSSCAERALRVMEAASGCAEGREAICEDAERAIGAVLGRMMKVGREGTEAAVVVLWSICHLFRDRRALEAVAAGGGGITKFLLLMQSYCSPATRQMAGDLLKIFRVNTKSCLSGYDTKTTHIMPF